MLDTIICTCCGEPLGRLIHLYDKLVDIDKRLAKASKAPKVLMPNLLQANDYVFETGGTLDLLHLTLECCRMHMLSKTRPAEIR